MKEDPKPDPGDESFEELDGEESDGDEEEYLAFAAKFERREQQEVEERERAKAKCRQAKKVAKRQGVPFAITAEYIEGLYRETVVCPIFGVPLVRRKGQGGHDDTPSLDRVIPEKGYVAGNVAVICQRANRIKHEANRSELRAILDYIDRHLDANKT